MGLRIFWRYFAYMRQIIHKHKIFWSQNHLRWSGILSFTFLILSLFINYAANVYVTNRASNSVSDLFLDILPVINISWVFFQGTVIFFIFIAWLLLKEPKNIPFVLKSMATFILIRSAFITLTHLAAPPEQPVLSLSNAFNEITSGNDLFFSSHTGMPFLMALIFWQNKRLRIFFICLSVFFGASVLLGHLHYSIDVFAAFFITYGICHIAQWLFAKDYELFLKEEEDN